MMIPVVAACCINDGRVLLQSRKLDKSYREFFNFPGGKVEVGETLEEALALKGKPYDKVFAVDNEAYYCSELVYEIFRRANDNSPVFTLQPMTFRQPGTGHTQQAWQEYFSALGVSIPEGQPGINPGGISRSAALTIIHKYGNPDRNLQSKRQEPSTWKVTSRL